MPVAPRNPLSGTIGRSVCVDGEAVADLLAQAAREQTRAVIIVSHDLRLEGAATRVVWMEDGRLREGAPVIPASSLARR